MRRIKAHRSYTAAELAEVCRVTIFTVYRWVGQGLAPIRGIRPYLFVATTIVEFLKRKNKPRQPCAPGEVFCVGCKLPVRPVGDVADVLHRSPTSADVVGRCPRCGRLNHQRVRYVVLAMKFGGLELRYEDGTTTVGRRRDAARTAVQGELDL